MNIILALAATSVVTQFAGMIYRKSVLAQWISIVSFVYGAIWQLKVMDSVLFFGLGMFCAILTFLRVFYTMGPKESEQ